MLLEDLSGVCERIYLLREGFETIFDPSIADFIPYIENPASRDELRDIEQYDVPYTFEIIERPDQRAYLYIATSLDKLPKGEKKNLTPDHPLYVYPELLGRTAMPPYLLISVTASAVSSR